MWNCPKATNLLDYEAVHSILQKFQIKCPQNPHFDNLGKLYKVAWQKLKFFGRFEVLSSNFELKMKIWKYFVWIIYLSIINQKFHSELKWLGKNSLTIPGAIYWYFMFRSSHFLSFHFWYFRHFSYVIFFQFFSFLPILPCKM